MACEVSAALHSCETIHAAEMLSFEAAVVVAGQQMHHIICMPLFLWTLAADLIMPH